MKLKKFRVRFFFSVRWSFLRWRNSLVFVLWFEKEKKWRYTFLSSTLVLLSLFLHSLSGKIHSTSAKSCLLRLTTPTLPAMPLSSFHYGVSSARSSRSQIASLPLCSGHQVQRSTFYSSRLFIQYFLAAPNSFRLIVCYQYFLLSIGYYIRAWCISIFQAPGHWFFSSNRPFFGKK